MKQSNFSLANYKGYQILEYLGGIETEISCIYRLAEVQILEYLGGIETRYPFLLEAQGWSDFRIPRRD